MIGLGLSLTGQRTMTSIAALLFALGEAGFVYPVWDRSTLYQDRAGTTLVTDAGQSVGVMLDTSKQQAFEARRNLMAQSAGDTGWAAAGTTLPTVTSSVSFAGQSCTSVLFASGSPVGYTACRAARSIQVTPWLNGVTYAQSIDIALSRALTGAEALQVQLYSSAGLVGSYTINAGNSGALAAGAFGRISMTGAGGGTGSIWPVITPSGSPTSDVTVYMKGIQIEVAPVSAYQAIGASLPVSWAGNHAIAINDSARGIYGWMPKTGVRNRATETEFRNGLTDAPSRAGLISATTLTGYLGAIAFGYDGVTDSSAYKQLALTLGTTVVFSVIVEMTDGLGPPVFSATPALRDFLLVMESIFQPVGNHVVTSLGGGLYRVSATKVMAATATTNFGVVKMATYSNRTFKVTGYQVEIDALTAYQRVNSQYDVTEAGVQTCYYVRANGVNTAYVTPTITPATDKVQMFAGVQKLSDATAAMLMEMSANSTTNAGTSFLVAPNSGTIEYGFRSKGTITADASLDDNALRSPIFNVLSGYGDIAGDISVLRVNGTDRVTTTTDQGTGNFLAYPAYLFARGGTTLPFNGCFFGGSGRWGNTLPAAIFAATERLIAQNTPQVPL